MLCRGNCLHLNTYFYFFRNKSDDNNILHQKIFKIFKFVWAGMDNI